MTKRFSRETRESALARVAAGEDPAIVAASIEAHPGTVLGWKRKAEAPAAEAPGTGAGAAAASKALGPNAIDPQAPPPSPEALVDAMEALRVMTIKGLAEFKGLDSENTIVERIATFKKSERAALSALAPEVCKYAPAVLHSMPQICAVSFVLIWGMGTFSAYRTISALAIEAKKQLAEKEERETKDTPRVNGSPLG